MIQKKRTLDDRLKRKREQRIKTEELQSESGIENARVGIAQQEEAIAEAEVARLQAVCCICLWVNLKEAESNILFVYI